MSTSADRGDFSTNRSTQSELEQSLAALVRLLFLSPCLPAIFEFVPLAPPSFDSSV
eukprot:m.252880 g.252880  ORF g.252880 m.252880 type:complete len:56 (+) comp10991_c0_seq13:1963-2130(+)